MTDAQKFAAIFAALGHEARLSIVRLLLAAHPTGMFAGQIQENLGIPASTLSHHLDMLRQQGLVEQRREGKFLRYAAATETLQKVLGFLYDECSTRVDIASMPAPPKRRTPWGSG